MSTRHLTTEVWSFRKRLELEYHCWGPHIDGNWCQMSWCGSPERGKRELKTMGMNLRKSYHRGGRDREHCKRKLRSTESQDFKWQWPWRMIADTCSSFWAWPSYTSWPFRLEPRGSDWCAMGWDDAPHFDAQPHLVLPCVILHPLCSNPRWPGRVVHLHRGIGGMASQMGVPWVPEGLTQTR
jgi:hypothetical protein